MARLGLHARPGGHPVSSTAAAARVIHGWDLGDSTVQGDGQNQDLASGGTGNTVERLRGRLSGTSCGNGYQAMHRRQWVGNGSRSTLDGWALGAGGVNDLVPWGGYTATTNHPGGVYVIPSGAGNIATWTRPTTGYPVAAVDIVYIDSTSYGRGSYNVGAGWVNLPSSGSATPTVKLARATVANPTTVQVRGADTTPTAHNVAIGGLVAWSVNPATASGFMVHNLGHAGAALSDLQYAGSGDPLSLLDAVGCDVVILGSFTNEVPGTGTGQFQPTLQALATASLTRTNAVYVVKQFFQVPGASRTQSNMLTLRTQSGAVATALGLTTVDYTTSPWHLNNDGYASPGAANSADGLLEPDGLHPTETGADGLASILAPIVTGSFA